MTEFSSQDRIVIIIMDNAESSMEVSSAITAAKQIVVELGISGDSREKRI